MAAHNAVGIQLFFQGLQIVAQHGVAYLVVVHIIYIDIIVIRTKIQDVSAFNGKSRFPILIIKNNRLIYRMLSGRC